MSLVILISFEASVAARLISHRRDPTLVKYSFCTFFHNVHKIPQKSCQVLFAIEPLSLWKVDLGYLLGPCSHRFGF